MGEWKLTNLSREVGGPTPNLTANLTSYTFAANDTQHVIYLGTDANVQEIWWHKDRSDFLLHTLTASPNQPTAGSQLASFSVGQAQNICFYAAGPAVKHLESVLPGKNWIQNTIVHEETLNPQGYAWARDNTNVVVAWFDHLEPAFVGVMLRTYTAQQGQPGSWSPLFTYTPIPDALGYLGNSKLTGIGSTLYGQVTSFEGIRLWEFDVVSREGRLVAVPDNAPLPAPGTGLTSWIWTADNGSEHLVYCDYAQHVIELYRFAGQDWNFKDLTEETGGGICAPWAPLTSWVWPEEVQHVAYVGPDAHVHELWCAKGQAWQHSDLTTHTSGKLAIASQITSFAWPESQHVVYVDELSHLIELYKY